MKLKTLFLALVLLLPACATTKPKDFCSRLDVAVEENDLQQGIRLMQEKLAEQPEAKTEEERTNVLHKELNKCGYYSAFNYNP